MNNKKVISIIVPHEDDELNVFGQSLSKAKSLGYEIHVVFSTNSDSSPKQTNKRYKEAKKVFEIFNIDNVFYLGYPDHPSSFKQKHLYNILNNEEYTSLHGINKTYGVENNDFSFLFSQRHSTLTKISFIKDIQLYLDLFLPDIIFCIGYDSHPDHRALFLSFQEAIANLLTTKNYKPLVFYSFAYLGKWHGPSDYFKIPSIETLNVETSSNHECLPFTWEDRISIKHRIEPLFWKDPLYKAFSKYKSQRGKMYFFKVANSDSVFWNQKTNNLSFYSQILVSSGNGCCLNDFKYGDVLDVCDKSQYPGSDEKSYWRPSFFDEKKEIKFVLSKTFNVKQIIIHEKQSNDSKILNVRVSLGRTHKNFDVSKRFKNCIIFDKKNTCSEIIIQIQKYIGSDWGITEVEVIPDEREEKWMDEFITSLSDITNDKYNRFAFFVGEFVYALLYFIDLVFYRIPNKIKSFFK